MKIECFGISDIGKVRGMNQDAFCMYQKDDAGLFAVADGMGGYANGEKASQAVIEELACWWESFTPDLYECDFRKMLLAIEQAIEAANGYIYREYNRNEACGTTVVALFVYGGLCGVIYAGDSRCYMSQERSWKALTIDEVWENQPDISKEELAVKNHPNRGKLTNAVGTRASVRCRVATDSVLPKTTFLLCSDGLYKFCEDRVMKSCMRHARDMRSMERMSQRLLDRVYKNGAGDNITVIIVRCS